MLIGTSEMMVQGCFLHHHQCVVVRWVQKL